MEENIYREGYGIRNLSELKIMMRLFVPYVGNIKGIGFINATDRNAIEIYHNEKKVGTVIFLAFDNEVFEIMRSFTNLLTTDSATTIYGLLDAMNWRVGKPKIIKYGDEFIVVHAKQKRYINVNESMLYKELDDVITSSKSKYLSKNNPASNNSFIEGFGAALASAWNPIPWDFKEGSFHPPIYGLIKDVKKHLEKYETRLSKKRVKYYSKYGIILEVDEEDYK